MSDGREQSEGRLARVQTGVLNDDRLVGLDEGGVVGLARNGLGIVEVVEPKVQSPFGRDLGAIGAGWIAVGEEDRYLDRSVPLSRIQDAGGLVALEGGSVPGAGTRDVALRDRPGKAPIISPSGRDL